MFSIQNYSISKKLTWMNMLVSGVALLLACGGFCAYDLYSFRDALVRNLSIQAEIIGDNTASALLFDDSHSAEKTLSALAANRHLVSPRFTRTTANLSRHIGASARAGHCPCHLFPWVKVSSIGSGAAVWGWLA